MYVVIVALAVIAVLVWLGRRTDRRDWRVAAGVMAAVAMVGCVAAAVRGAWVVAIALGVFSAWLSVTTRRRPEAPTILMSEQDARSLLGVGPGASPEEIQAAYVRLMKSVHPDRGGTAGLAAQLNAARDRLLKR